jgi:hypothetical protein
MKWKNPQIRGRRRRINRQTKPQIMLSTKQPHPVFLHIHNADVDDDYTYRRFL